MSTRTTRPVALWIAAFLTGACVAAPAGTASVTPSHPGPSTAETLLPEGVWEAELSTTELIDAGAPADSTGGTFRWVFDGTRARVTFNEDEWHCDADASRSGAAVHLAWHMAVGCGGFDDIAWTIADDGLHLSHVATSGDEEFTVAVLEAKPYQAVEGDSTLSWSDAWTTCDYPDGGACLGRLTAGTYATDAFEPGLTYTVPDGWQNTSDLQGEVVLLAAGESATDLQAEYIAVFTSVYAQNRKCSTEDEAISDEPGVAETPEVMAAEFQARPGLAVTAPQAVTVGGLSGLVMDISMAPDWTGTCFYSNAPAVQLIGGVAPSLFDHSIVAGLTVRLYLLARGGSTLAIEVSDYADGTHLDGYSEIVEQFAFGS